MKTEEKLLEILHRNGGEIILFDTLGCQKMIGYDKSHQSLYYLIWSPRENTGEPREYLTIEQAIKYIQEYKPMLLNKTNY